MFLDAVNGMYIEAAVSLHFLFNIFIFSNSIAAYYHYGYICVFWERIFSVHQSSPGAGPVHVRVHFCVYLSRYGTALMTCCEILMFFVDISLTTAALFPYPFYLVGRAIAAPVACHSAIALLSSIFVFPSTISALFTTRLGGVIAPMLSTLTLHRTLLSNPISSPSFATDLIAMRTETKKVEGALIPLAAAARLLKSDLIYGRFAPEDFRTFQNLFRRLAGRADGLAVYWTLVDPGRERFPGTANPTPAGTAPGTPHRVLSRPVSRAGSPERGEAGVHVGDASADTGPRSVPMLRSESITTSASRLRPSLAVTGALGHSHSRSVHSVAHSHVHLHSPLVGHTHSHDGQYHHHHHHHLLHSSLLSLARSRARTRKPEYAVGTFESQRYLNLEMTRLHDPHEDEYTENTVDLLRERCISYRHNALHIPFLDICVSS